MTMKESSNNTVDRQWSSLLGWYLLFGALHEAAHIITAHTMGLSHGIIGDGSWSGYGSFLVNTLLLRQTVIPALSTTQDLAAAWLVRHAAWIFSVLLIFWTRKSKNARLAATLTALEALSTDLLGLYRGASGVLFCGNFGIICLHQAWSTADNGKTALDILEKMVSVTMMRGAQSGACGDYEYCALSVLWITELLCSQYKLLVSHNCRRSHIVSKIAQRRAPRHSHASPQQEAHRFEQRSAA